MAGLRGWTPRRGLQSPNTPLIGDKGEIISARLALDDRADRGVSFGHGNGCQHCRPVAPLDGERRRDAAHERPGPDALPWLWDVDAG